MSDDVYVDEARRRQVDGPQLVDEIGIDYVQGFFIRHPEPWDA